MCHSEIPTAMRKNWNIKISCIENTIKAINPKQQNGGRKPIQLKNRVEEELNKLIDLKHIIKFDKFLHNFSSPIVIR